MSDLNSEDLKRFTEEINNLVSNGINPMGSASQSASGNLGEFAEAVKKLESLKELSKTVLKAKDALGEFVDSVEDAIEEQEKSDKAAAKTKLDAAKQFGKGLLQAGESYMGAMSDATQGTGKYAKSVEQLGLSARQLGDAFGGLGSAAGYGVEKLMQWAAASLKQNDALNKSYEALAKFGQVDNTDLQNLMHSFHDMGLTMQNAQIYIDAVTKASSDLALFGSTAAKGREQFEKAFQGMLSPETQDKLFRLGYNTQSIIESSADIMASLAISSKNQKNDTAALHKQTLEYLETYSEVTALTGKNRDDMAAERRQQENDLGFQLYLEKLRAEGPEGERKAANESLNAMLYNMVNKKAGQAYQAYARSGGSFVGPDAGAMIPVLGTNSFKESRRAALSATGSREQGVNAVFDAAQSGLAKNYLRAVQLYSGNLAVSPTGNMEQFGLNTPGYKAAKILGSRGSRDLDELRGSLAEIPDSDRRGMLSKQTTAERQFQQFQDNAVYSMGNLTVPAVTTLAQAANTAADALSTMSDAVAGTFGASGNWNRSFKSFEKLSDVSEELTKQQKKQTEYLEVINKTREDIENIDAQIKTLEDKRKGGKLSAVEENQLSTLRKNKGSLSEKMAQNTQLFQKSEREASRAVTAGTRIQQSGGDVLAGLPVYSKSGDSHAPGNYVDPAMVEKMWQIIKIPGVSHFTSVNDRFHNEKAPNSLHTKGKAVDLVLNNEEGKNRPSQESIAAAVSALQSMGLKVRDEYNYPSDKATAPHIHAELKARTGGIFSGPQSGYKVELHGKEAVVPLSTSQQFGKTYSAQNVTKHSLNNPGASLNSAFSGGTSGGMSNAENILRNLMNMLIGRFDDMIYELQTSNNTQSKIAKNSKKKS